MRIVSAVPSQTELLYDLGLDEEVVGITKFCIHPDSWFRRKTRIGGTKTLHLEQIAQLRPDWVLANKEENVKEQIEACSHWASIYVSDISDLDDAVKMIADVGKIVQKEESALQLTGKISEDFKRLGERVSAKVSAAYLIWQNPLMTIGQDTFIHDMMMRNGWDNVFTHYRRYPEISREELVAAAPEVLFLSSEPYPFGDRHIADFQRLLPDTKILLVDGTYFSWYGSRLAYAVSYFDSIYEQIGR